MLQPIAISLDAQAPERIDEARRLRFPSRLAYAVTN